MTGLDSPAALLARLKYHAQAKLADAERRTTDSVERFARNIGQGEAMAWREVAAVLKGSTANTDTLNIVALWSESGYHDHRYEVGLYFTVEAAKREAQAHYSAQDGDPETLIWMQREGTPDPIWTSHIEAEGDPDRGAYAIYPREVWA